MIATSGKKAFKQKICIIFSGSELNKIVIISIFFCWFIDIYMIIFINYYNKGFWLMVEKNSEVELIRRSQKGDTEAFGRLVEKYQNRIYGYIYHLIGNKTDAEDITQEVFIKAYRSIKRFNLKSSFYTWLYRIAHNLVVDKIRHNKIAFLPIESPSDPKQESLLQHTPDHSSPVEESVIKEQIRKSILENINKLQIEYKSVIILRYIQGRSYVEIAKILRRSIRTVGSRLFRALQQLRKLKIAEGIIDLL